MLQQILCHFIRKIIFEEQVAQWKLWTGLTRFASSLSDLVETFQQPHIFLHLRTYQIGVMEPHARQGC